MVMIHGKNNSENDWHVQRQRIFIPGIIITFGDTQPPPRQLDQQQLQRRELQQLFERRHQRQSPQDEPQRERQQQHQQQQQQEQQEEQQREQQERQQLQRLQVHLPPSQLFKLKHLHKQTSIVLIIVHQI